MRIRKCWTPPFLYSVWKIPEWACKCRSMPSAVLHWFRRFDDYQALKNQALWKPLPEYTREEFSVGIMGAGVLGAKVAESLQAWGFPLRCWSRSRKSRPGVESYVGREELHAFLNQTRVLINLLPNTAQTVGIINSELLDQLPDGAYVLNLARRACSGGGSAGCA